MSHVTIGEFYLEHSDVDLLGEAAKELGGVFHKNQLTWKWFGSWVNDFSGERAAASQGFDPEKFGKGLHAISFPGSNYEIGVVESRDGKGLELIYDGWGSNGQAIAQRVGTQMEKLKQMFTALKGLKSARAKYVPKGYRVKKIVHPTGRIQIRIEKG